jgi:hypothetical protein
MAVIILDAQNKYVIFTQIKKVYFHFEIVLINYHECNFFFTSLTAAPYEETRSSLSA